MMSFLVGIVLVPQCFNMSARNLSRFAYIYIIDMQEVKEYYLKLCITQVYYIQYILWEESFSVQQICTAFVSQFSAVYP